MIYVRYVFLVIISMLADILNYVLAPFAVLFASKDGWLPNWLWWLQTPDNSLDGDGGWKKINRPFIVEDSAFKVWWNRTSWLYRNSMYGFAIYVLGAVIKPGDTLEVVGNPKVSNRPLLNGLVVRRVIRNGVPVYFQWYYVKAWSELYCIRINLGWKLWAFDKGNCQLVHSPSFTMGYVLPK